MRENSSAFFLRRLHDDDGLTNHNKKEEGRLDMQAADSWQLSPLNEQLVKNGQKNQKQCECEETTVVGMLLLCSRVLILHYQKHCLSTTCLSLPAAFQQLCPFLLIFPSSLLSTLLPSFLPSFHSLTLTHTVSRSTYRPCHSGGGRSIGASHQQEVIQMPSPWRQMRLS